MGTFAVLLVVVLIAGLAARSIIKDKKSGKACAGCSGCSGQCHGSCGSTSAAHTLTQKKGIVHHG